MPVETEAVRDAGSFETAFGVFVGLPLDHPSRATIRAKLLDYALRVTDQALDAQDAGEALRALQLAVSLFAPRELNGPTPHAALAASAQRLYSTAAAEGRETPAVFCLAVLHQFGSESERKTAEIGWVEIEEWIDRGGEFAAAPGQLTDVVTVLEQTVSVFPTAWSVDRLTAQHLRTYQAAIDAPYGEYGRALRRRAEFTGYLLARIHLRADDPQAARAVLDQLEGNDETAHLQSMLAAALDEGGSASDRRDAYVRLIAYFQPAEEGALPPWVITQTWGIVANLARRVLTETPEHAFANLAMGRSLRALGLSSAAIGFYERSLAGDEDLFETWSELASLYQERLDTLARENGDARAHLDAVEAFHRRGAKLWRNRAIEPSLARAYVTVAASLYDSGEIAESRTLASRSLELEPTAAAHDLVGSIDHHRGELKAARSRFEAIIDMPFEGPAERVHWEIAAHLRLSDIAAEGKDAARARKHLKAALRHLNTVLSYRLAESERGLRHVERGRVFFRLGEIELAMADFRSAASVSPADPRAYVDPLVLAIEHGYYDEALEVYGRTMAQPAIGAPLKLYATLWIRELGSRLGRGEVEGVESYLSAYRGDQWPGRLAAHARGELTLDELLAAANDRGERAEAYFYEGLREFGGGSIEAGLELMSNVLETEMMSFFEYEMARHYVSLRDAPRSARAPITSPAAGAPSTTKPEG
jgi:tetratricopeptide (TPR) repeat protein